MHVCVRLQVVGSTADVQGGGKAAELVVQEGVTVVLPMKGLFDAEKEVQRLKKQKDKTSRDLSGLQARLSNPKFVNSAPADVVASVRRQAAELGEMVTLIEKKISQAQALL
jgi:valyl-tRNA synthetase